MSGSLRILHIGNGKAFKIKTIVDAFVARGHELHMVPIPPAEGHWDGVTWHNLPDPVIPGQAKVAARMYQVRKLAGRLRPDVVNAHNAWGPGWYGAAAGHHPFVIHAYGGDILPEQTAGRPAVQRALTSWTFRAADSVLIDGRHMIDAAVRLGVQRGRLVVLPRGVDLERYRPGLDTTELRQRLRVGAAGPVILSPRYQVDETLYNLDVVVDAFVAVRKRFAHSVCIQLYDPARESGRTRLQGLAAERGISDAYHLFPAVDNAAMPLFYNLADVVVSVPSSDGFPVTVLEASACAAALVVSDLPYCREWFQNGINGVVIPVADSKSLADALITLCSDSNRRRKMGSAGRRLVEERADCRRYMDELESVYWNLLGRRPGGEDI